MRILKRWNHWSEIRSIKSRLVFKFGEFDCGDRYCMIWSTLMMIMTTEESSL